MSDLGSIQILIKTIYDATGIRMSEADLQKFVGTGAQAKAAANGIGVAAQAAQSNLAALMSSLEVGSGIGALIGLAKAEASTVMETQRLALVMGMTVEDTSRWAYAMKLATGHSDGLSLAAFHASHALEEIRNGTGPAAAAIHAMGIDPSGLRGIPDLLLKLGDFIQSSALPQEQKLALAQEVLGRSAREIYPLLAKGGEGMRQLGMEADKAGTVIDQSMVAASKKFTIELEHLQNILKKGIGLPLVEFVAAHENLTALAGAVVVLGAAYKTLQVTGLLPSLQNLISLTLASRDATVAATFSGRDRVIVEAALAQQQTATVAALNTRIAADHAAAAAAAERAAATAPALTAAQEEIQATDVACAATDRLTAARLANIAATNQLTTALQSWEAIEGSASATAVERSAAVHAVTEAELQQTFTVSELTAAEAGAVAATDALAAAQARQATAAATATEALTAESSAVVTYTQAEVNAITAADTAATKTKTSLSAFAGQVGIIVSGAVAWWKVLTGTFDMLSAQYEAWKSKQSADAANDQVIKKFEQFRSVAVKSSDEIHGLAEKQAQAYRHDLTGAISLAAAEVEKFSTAGGPALRAAQARLAEYRQAYNEFRQSHGSTPGAPAGTAVAPPAPVTVPVKLATEEAALGTLEKKSALLNSEDRETAVVKKAAIDAAPNYAAQKAARADYEQFQKSADDRELLRLEAVNTAKLQLASDKRNQATTALDTAEATDPSQLQGEAKATAEKAIEDAKIAKIKANAEYFNQDLENRQSVADLQRKFDEEKRHRDGEAIKLSKQDQLAALEAIATDERRNLAERIQAVRAEYKLKEQLASPGERAKLEVEKDKAIAGIESKAEGKMPEIHADRLAQVGGFVGTGASGSSHAQKTNDLLERILREGIKVTNHPPGLSTRD